MCNSHSNSRKIRHDLGIVIPNEVVSLPRYILIWKMDKPVADIEDGYALQLCRLKDAIPVDAMHNSHL